MQNLSVCRWLISGVLVTLVAVQAGRPALAQTKLRFQSAFPPSGLYYENSQLLAERVKALSGGKLQIAILPAGSVVPAYEVLDAVHKGVVDGGHASAAYWIGKNRASGLFGTAPGGPFGMDMTDYFGWLYDGGGLELYREFYQKVLKRNIVVFPMTTGSGQPLGWFKSPVKSWDDLKGRKCRETGFNAEIFGKAGMKPVNIAGGEVVPAGERGVIECAEFVGPAEDMRIGFQSIWKYFYMPSVHDTSSVVELLINGEVWKKLAPEHREIIQSATLEVAFRSRMISNKLDAQAMLDLKEQHAVKIERTPTDILVKILQSWDEIAKEEAAKNPFFKKVYNSQRAYAAKVVPARRALYPAYDFAADYYWPGKK